MYPAPLFAYRLVAHSGYVQIDNSNGANTYGGATALIDPLPDDVDAIDINFIGSSYSGGWARTEFGRALSGGGGETLVLPAINIGQPTNGIVPIATGLLPFAAQKGERLYAQGMVNGTPGSMQLDVTCYKRVDPRMPRWSGSLWNPQSHTSGNFGFGANSNSLWNTLGTTDRVIQGVCASIATADTNDFGIDYAIGRSRSGGTIYEIGHRFGSINRGNFGIGNGGFLFVPCLIPAGETISIYLNQWYGTTAFFACDGFGFGL